MTTQATGDSLSPREAVFASSLETLEEVDVPEDGVTGGVGEMASSLEDAREEELDQLEPKGRFCDLLACLDSCLPVCIVDYIDQLFESIYNYIAPLFASQLSSENPDFLVKNSTVLKIFDPGDGARFCLLDGNIYKIYGKLDSPLDWVAKDVQIQEDEVTRSVDDGSTATYLCTNLDTKISVRVAFVGHNENIEEEIQRQGPCQAVTSIMRVVQPLDLYSLPILETTSHRYTVLGRIDPSEWQENLLIDISDDEQTKIDGSQLCSSSTHRVRVRYCPE
jgi:hypothetical protein